MSQINPLEDPISDSIMNTPAYSQSDYLINTGGEEEIKQEENNGKIKSCKQ